MRDIKFRAWHNERNEWLHDTDHACNLLGEMILLGGWCRVPILELNDIVVEQYTGLKDKHGVEIYEGDILQMDYGDKALEAICIEPVVWCAQKAMFTTIDRRGVVGDTLGSYGLEECVEIIGNIHDDFDELYK